ncbi:MAG: FliH/SctL family protein [Roseburia sp.]|nr:FliH/SctL family protein [Roseburia sp.]
MSNFFKQYNVVEEHSDVRMIDYNAMAQEKLRKLAAKQAPAASAGADGFQSLDSIVPQEPVKSPEEILQEAKDEAEQILKDARNRSDDMLNDAYQKSEQIKLQAKEEGHSLGYKEGSEEARSELEAEYAKKQEELEAHKLSLQEDYNREMKELEPMLLDTILTVVEKVFHIQFSDKKDILLYLVENAILNIEGCKNFRIRVGEEQRAFLERRKEEILEQVGHDVSLEILSDPSFREDECVIETDTGIFDCGTGVQLENLIKDIKALIS